MEQRRTLTMNWDGLGDVNDDDELFFDAQRLSAVVPQDLASSGSDDDDEEFDDSRMSFSSTVSSASTAECANFMVSAPAFPTNEYDMWTTAPGSINDRRRRLLQDMGLCSNKDLLRLGSSKLNKALSKRMLSRKINIPPPNASVQNINQQNAPPVVKESSAHSVVRKHDEQPQPQPQPQLQAPQPQPQPQPRPQPSLPSSSPALLVRSRSDGDIDTSSLNTKRRKEEMIGSISKQRLTRTLSGFMTSCVGLSRQYNNVVKASPIKGRRMPSVSKDHCNDDDHTTGMTQNGQLDSFFLIKNLDTGKEFVVKEFSNEGMWNKLSDLQTGKQLTMEEFERSVGHSPAVKELMRRANDSRNVHGERKLTATNSSFRKSFRNSKKRGAALLKNIKGSMSGSKTDKERDTTNTTTLTNNNNTLSSGEQKPSSQWVKARVHGKPYKEFTALHQSQEIQAHDGSIWAMKFTYDGHYLATAGEDAMIHIWEVQECDVMSMRPGDELSSAGSTPVHPMATVAGSDGKPPLADSTPEKKKKGKVWKKKGGKPDYVQVPETVFGLSENPFCSLKGHQEDVLDLSWSRSQLLLSSSMDKTVRLWDIETKNCLKVFSHNDYVTCIQFNPADDDYFISGSLDAKVRIWSIPDRQVADWTDLHEMVTAVGYSPDGKGAVAGSHKGICRFYNTTDYKLELKDQIELRTKKKPQPKKITGFQYSTWNPSEVLVTSADSRIRILDGTRVVQKFKGYKNNNSQFSADYSPDGKYVISASEDSQVYIWKHEEAPGKSKHVITKSYEHFPCKEVSVTVPWPGSSKLDPPLVEMHSKRHSKRSTTMLPPSSPGFSPSHDDIDHSKRSPQLPPLPKRNNNSMESIEDIEHHSHIDSSIGPSDSFNSTSGASARYDEIFAFPSNFGSHSWSRNEGGNHGNNTVQARAWRLVIVTAGLGGEVKVYQNVGLPFKVSRQANFF